MTIFQPYGHRRRMSDLSRPITVKALHPVMRRRRAAHRVALAALALLAAATNVHARVYVSKTTVAEYPLLRVLERDHVLAIPAGQRVTITLSDGSKRQLTSADKGTIASILGPEPAPASWWAQVMKWLDERGASQDTVGGTRSLTAAAVNPAEGLGVSGTPISRAVAADTICVVKGQTAMITRAGEAQVAALDVEVSEGSAAPTPSTRRSAIRMAAGQMAVPWPAAVPLSDQVQVRLQPATGAARITTVRLIPASTVAALTAAGCRTQALAAASAD
jgi:hypothetical protein